MKPLVAVAVAAAFFAGRRFLVVETSTVWVVRAATDRTHEGMHRQHTEITPVTSLTYGLGSDMFSTFVCFRPCPALCSHQCACGCSRFLLSARVCGMWLQVSDQVAETSKLEEVCVLHAPVSALHAPVSLCTCKSIWQLCVFQ